MSVACAARWVPVSERLPDNHTQEVLWADASGILFYDDAGVVLDLLNDVAPTHWLDGIPEIPARTGPVGFAAHADLRRRLIELTRSYADREVARLTAENAELRQRLANADEYVLRA